LSNFVATSLLGEQEDLVELVKKRLPRDLASPTGFEPVLPP
jgi:hypothetical protein